MAGALLTYLSEFVTKGDFGQWTPVIMTLWAIFVNASRKFLTGPVK